MRRSGVGGGTTTLGTPSPGDQTVTMDTRQVHAVPATPATFAPFGTLITMDHQAPEGSLDLSQGTPRLWVMPLYDVGLSFSSITRHRRVTQCLASATGHHWFLGVAAPGTDPAANPDCITVFRVPGGAFVQLSVGTWHAGPYFEPPRMRFYNLELAGTNHDDHDTVALPLSFTIDPDPTGEFRRRRVLVVANRTANSPELLSAIGRLNAQELAVSESVYDAEEHYHEVRRKWFDISITRHDGRRETLRAEPVK